MVCISFNKVEEGFLESRGAFTDMMQGGQEGKYTDTDDGADQLASSSGSTNHQLCGGR